VFSSHESGIIPAIVIGYRPYNRKELMQKLLIYWVCGASLLATGCSTFKEASNAIPDALNKLPLIHRPDIQQGNVVSQESINKLKPGMSKSQVSYLLGTPMLVDVFHQNRWDYYYSMKQGNEAPLQQRVALYFEDDRLTRIEGDYRPQAEPPLEDKKLSDEEVVITVPDYTGDRQGIFSRALESVGIKSDD
jgi:outer membrane protein assembly factor BamE